MSRQGCWCPRLRAKARRMDVGTRRSRPGARAAAGRVVTATGRGPRRSPASSGTAPTARRHQREHGQARQRRGRAGMPASNTAAPAAVAIATRGSARMRGSRSAAHAEPEQVGRCQHGLPASVAQAAPRAPLGRTQHESTSAVPTIRALRFAGGAAPCGGAARSGRSPTWRGERRRGESLHAGAHVDGRLEAVARDHLDRDRRSDHGRHEPAPIPGCVGETLRVPSRS